VKDTKLIGIGIAIAVIAIVIIVIISTANQTSKSLTNNQTIANPPANTTTSPPPITPSAGRHLQLNLTETVGIKGLG